MLSRVGFALLVSSEEEAGDGSQRSRGQRSAFVGVVIGLKPPGGFEQDAVLLEDVTGFKQLQVISLRHVINNEKRQLCCAPSSVSSRGNRSAAAVCWDRWSPERVWTRSGYVPVENTQPASIRPHLLNTSFIIRVSEGVRLYLCSNSGHVTLPLSWLILVQTCDLSDVTVWLFLFGCWCWYFLSTSDLITLTACIHGAVFSVAAGS